MVHTIDNQNESVMVDDGVNSLSRLRGFHKLQIYEMLCLGASLKKTKEWDVLENGAFASALFLSNVFGVRGHTLIMLEHKGT